MKAICLACQIMPSKKASSDNNLEQPQEREESDSSLGDLEAHISQRINQLQTVDDSTDVISQLGLAGGNGESDLSSAIPQFEPFEGYEFASLHGAEHSYSSGYEKVRESYQESGEVLKSIHSLSDQLTDSILSLNVRLTDLEARLKDVTAAHKDEIKKLKQDIKAAPWPSSIDPALFGDLHKAIASLKEQMGEKGPKDEKGQTGQHSIADYMNELQKQVTFLKERMDRNVVEMAGKLEERQGAFYSILDTRVKAMEKISLGYKQSLDRNFFNLAVLVMIIVVIAGVVISGTVDRMSGYVSQQLDALRAAVRESMEASGHPPGSVP